MKSFKFFSKTFTVLLSVILMQGCATQTAFKKRELNVQTKMSHSIFLDPVAPDKRVALVQIRNTSDKPELDLSSYIKTAIEKKGYKLTEDPKQAQYMIQANVLKVGKVDLRESEQALNQGYGGIVPSATAGAAAGSLLRDDHKGVLAGALIGAAAGAAADAFIKDISFSIVTDIQLSEKTEDGVLVEEKVNSNLQQGMNTRRTTASKERNNWKRYQTRIVSTANKSNLEFEEALPVLIAGLSNSISGVL